MIKVHLISFSECDNRRTDYVLLVCLSAMAIILGIAGIILGGLTVNITVHRYELFYSLASPPPTPPREWVEINSKGNVDELLI